MQFIRTKQNITYVNIWVWQGTYQQLRSRFENSIGYGSIPHINTLKEICVCDLRENFDVQVSERALCQVAWYSHGVCHFTVVLNQCRSHPCGNTEDIGKQVDFENRGRRLPLPGFQTSHPALAIKTVVLQKGRHGDQWDETESPEIDMLNWSWQRCKGSSTEGASNK